MGFRLAHYSVMTLAVKDIVYIVVYIISIAGVFFAFKNKLNNLTEEQNKEKKVIWQEGGRLNIVDHAFCRECRDQIYETIRKRDSIIEEFRAQLISLNENVIRIMVILERNDKNQIHTDK